MFSSLAVKGGIALVLVTACLFLTWRILKVLNPRPPRPPKIESFDVISVPTGNAIIVKGRRKRTITVTLKGIGVPDLPGAQEAARANLERLAGKKIKAELPRRRLRSEVTPEQEAFMVWFEKHYEKCGTCSIEPTKENPGPQMCDEAMTRMQEIADGADANKTEARSDEEFAELEWDLWYSKHIKTCSHCCSDPNVPMCEEAFAKLQEGMAEVECPLCEGYGKLIFFPDMLHEKEYEIVCFRCGGDGEVWRVPKQPDPPEARSDFTSPQAWGEAGLCLQLEQLRAGMAISVGDVPKEWAEAENDAKGAGRGIWGKP